MVKNKKHLSTDTRAFWSIYFIATAFLIILLIVSAGLFKSAWLARKDSYQTIEKTKDTQADHNINYKIIPNKTVKLFKPHDGSLWACFTKTKNCYRVVE